MEDSIELRTLKNLYPQLKIAFKSNTLSLANSFYMEGLIDSYGYDVITASRSFLTNSEKAGKMLQQILNAVELSSDKYHVIIKVLSMSKVHTPIKDLLEKEYIKNQGGASQPEADVQAGSDMWSTKPKFHLLQLIRYHDHQTEREIELRILDEISCNWEEIGDLLGFHPSEIESIRCVGSGKTLSQCIRDVISRWLQNEPYRSNYGHYPTTWRGVYKLLLDTMHSTIAKELTAAINATYSDLRGNYGSAPAGRVPVQSPVPVQPQVPAQPQFPPAKGRHKKMNKDQLAEWLSDQGILEVDVQKLKDRGVNQLLFQHLKKSDSYMTGLSEATKDVLEFLQGELKNVTL